jgi:transcriptional regulator with XRE-family HTH domain
MENILTVVGENIKDFRMIRRLSRRALAELVGLSGQAIWKIETGRSDPRLTNLNKIADALDTRVSALIVGRARMLSELSVDELNAVMTMVEQRQERLLNITAEQGEEGQHAR